MQLVQRIARHNKIAVLFTEHDMHSVFATADRILVLHQGKIIAEGDAAGIQANTQVQAIYLGAPA